MSNVKVKGAFAQVFRVLDENGNDTGKVRARATADIIIKKGQTLFLDPYEDNIKDLINNKFISASEGEQRLNVRRELDEKYNQKTIYALKAGDPSRIEETTESL